MSEEVQVEVLGVDELTDGEGAGTSCVVLRDTSMRHLSLSVGPCDATAIGSIVDGRIGERPSTHDSALRMLEIAGATMTRVTITEAFDGSYYALADLTIGDRPDQVDMRAPDAVAFAVRAKCPIFVAEHVMAENASEEVTP